MIVDAHAHLGYDEVFDVAFTEAELVKSQGTNGIDVTIIQPATAHDIDGARRQHDAVAAMAATYPGRYAGMANPNPHLDGYEAEVRRCIVDLGFVGVKIHPLAHAVNPLGRHGRRAFALAHDLGVPVMVHTGVGIPWAAPSLLGEAAAAYPDMPIVVAHAGGMILAAEAADLAARFPNVYLECSWMAGFNIRAWTERFGARRIMLGSDHADNAATEFAKFRTSGIDAAALREAMGDAAARVYGLPQSGAEEDAK